MEVENVSRTIVLMGEVWKGNQPQDYNCGHSLFSQTMSSKMASLAQEKTQMAVAQTVHS
jgi:hypothetical protein